MNYIEIKNKLYSMTDEKYRIFSSSLIPNHRNLIGIRLPLIRKLAKKIAKENALEFLNIAQDNSFEEIMLQGFVICEIKDFEQVLTLCEKHIPKIYNWSLCDSFVSGLKIFKSHRDKVLEFLCPYFSSSEVYDVRFAIVCLLNYFVEKDYLPQIFYIFDSIHPSDYYVKTAIAWAISVCFVKFPDDTMIYLKKCKLSKAVFNMSLQKIIESTRVNPDIKNSIKAMKK